MKKNFIIHPLLLSLYPLLFLYSNNYSQISVYRIFYPAVIIIFFSLLLFVFFNLYFKDRDKSALLLSSFIILFFSFGYFYAVENYFSIKIGALVVGPNKLLLVFWFFLFYLSFLIIKRFKKDLKNITKILNFFSFVLIILVLSNIFYYEIKSYRESDNVESSEFANRDERGVYTEGDNLPNIYYIILDEYAGHQSLKDYFNYDNQDIIDYLHENNFFVANKSRSNYSQTYLSLASSLNMEYIDYINEKEGKDSSGWRIINDKVNNNKVADFLRSKGYSFYNFRSGYGPTNFLTKADLNFQSDKWDLDEFYMTFLQTTIFRPFIEKSFQNDKRERILYTFDKVSELSASTEPFFALVHIVSPHSPYVFDKDGEKIYNNDCEKYDGDEWSARRKECYINELIFLNSKIKDLVKNILTNSKQEPVIIIQSDHGSKSSSVDLALNEDIKRERSDILNAYYMPHSKDIGLYDSITPVNSFRLLLDDLWGLDLEKLNDNIYFSSIDRPFNFIDISSDVKQER